MWQNTLRFSICIFVLTASQFPVRPEPETHSSTLSNEIERNQFQLPVNGLIEHKNSIRAGETFESIMSTWEIPQHKIYAATEKASSYINLRRINKNDPYYTYTDTSQGTLSFLVYQSSLADFLVFDLRDSVLVHKDAFPKSTVIRTGTGTIKNSLYQAIKDADLPRELALDMSKILAWQISFYHLQTGDDFSIVFEDHMAGERSTGTDIKGVRFNHKGKEFFAFHFSVDGIAGFYDEKGQPMKRPFLRAPIEYSRISSRFSLRRFHPVQKRYKPHLGTDFAAKTGTPIIATADGTVTHASYTRGNGYYVKIRHNDIYQTAYLHMSRFEPGIRPGTQLQQGDRIGYVGSTGLATGPHVCYRFWQNGKQVDAMTISMPPSEPLPEELFSQFEKVRNRIQPQLVASHRRSL